MEVVFGSRNERSSLFGPFFYFKTFNGAIRYAVWTSSYKDFIVGKKTLTKDGKWKQGAILRFAVFLDKHKILYKGDKIMDIADKGEWSETYSSLYFGRLRLKNNYVFHSCPSYGLKSFTQQVSLSYHFINMKKLPPVWDPLFNNYSIQ
jgi:hypothetical protein